MKKSFGDRVREARKNAGLTQAELAQKMNLSETTISRIENGSQVTSFETMVEFSDGLNVHLDFLLCDYLSGVSAEHDPVVQEILELLAPLPDNYRRYVRDNLIHVIEAFPTPSGKPSKKSAKQS
ncbi:helix-turn-helix domain-containing protein [Bariatricus massiliensis]|uniref:Helix-turn-helix domain-containing protein n=1 Tax=Bariatricus massiliensis TaxID=1745713 RepID=A0ABS8DB59_9FIRM|nr:helix-turn-helix transcriptional regulator [Bariatricus massiliensis]MCB7303587.1 helix-turn-helix domain-containing protein [Bariatricus massiliensis]MCB7373002.1 helix-turn-helix domain-containing protein [Bariatricus massiliensis]MCB7385672.1 helix-turn-helix domain-containing protein [Bariatricus massiliensis]MCB7409835.1 helix-turn-helix domain-containing protein [Bariatricus massiliensis]MCQ5254055.1 helix-turn-helix domain-containing protein [Bariatricus massiliensis]